VGTHFRRASVAGPQAKSIFLVPTRRRGNAFSTRQRRGAASPQKRDAFATQIGSHAGAWEPEKSVPTPARGNQKNWFPRRRVGTRKRCSKSEGFSRSHAPAWERIFDAPASRGRKLKVYFSFPRAGVGTHFRRASVAGPQAHKNGTLLLPKSVPTPARGNQKNRFPRRRVGTRKIGSHAGAWEPENAVPNLKVWTPTFFQI
jgi:hypothetical protein